MVRVKSKERRKEREKGKSKEGDRIGKEIEGESTRVRVDLKKDMNE